MTTTARPVVPVRPVGPGRAGRAQPPGPNPWRPGQLLLARKCLENWPTWLGVNLVSVALFAHKGLWLTAVLYALFASNRSQVLVQERTQGLLEQVIEQRLTALAQAQVLEIQRELESPLQITADLAIPTIGIGAGPGCDGQVLVLHDLLGVDSGHRRPRFVKDFLAEGGSVLGAFQAYAAAVRDGSFPAPEHGY